MPMPKSTNPYEERLASLLAKQLELRKLANAMDPMIQEANDAVIAHRRKALLESLAEQDLSPRLGCSIGCQMAKGFLVHSRDCQCVCPHNEQELCRVCLGTWSVGKLSHRVKEWEAKYER